MRGVLLTSVCLVSALFFACSSTDSTPSGGAGSGGSAGSAGSGGKASGGAGTSNAAGEGGAGGVDDVPGAAGDAGAGGASGSSVCLESGKGDIDLVVSGLPKTVAASVTISGPHDALESESTTLSDVPGGSYTVTAKRVYDSDPLVRTAYDPQISSPTFCLDDGGSATVVVNYAKVTPSHQLWTLLRSLGGAPQRGFGADTLAASGSPAATTEASLPIERVLAFDHAGDIWGVSIGSQPQIARYAPHWLGGVGEPLADYRFNLALDACVPATTNGGVGVPQIQSIALDASENIWLSVCDKKVLRIDRPDSSPGSSEEPEDIAPNVTLSGFTKQTEDLAFDGSGNLWVVAGGQVLRFDRARLGANDAGAPDLVLDVTTDDVAPSALFANFLAFDVTGNLWATDVAGHALFEIAKTDLVAEGTHTVVAKAQLALGDESVLNRAAFDDQGSLWISLSESSFGKLTAEQLAVSSTAAAPTVPSVVISSVGADSLAFFPAASGLPLPSAQP
ncbi:MAG TPA: hypothetical protein VER96_21380 [Polyangiaceae bacterium]|nr:hypothetical protein [Polyangiaceae bacterium]